MPYQNSYQCIIEHLGQLQPGDHDGIFSPSLDIVWSPTDITVDIKDTKMFVGHELSLVCNADANPAPKYEWEITHPNNTQVDKSHWDLNGRTSVIIASICNWIQLDSDSKFVLCEISSFCIPNAQAP